MRSSCNALKSVIMEDFPMSDYSISQIDGHTYRIDEEGVRFFLLEGTGKALLIDSGMMVHNAKEIAGTLTSLPLLLLNTHGDIDHVGSNEEFESFYMNDAEASNYYKVQKKKGIIIPLENGDILDLGDRKLEIITLPGHTPGSIGVLDASRGWLFSGDPVQDGSIFMFGVEREMHAYIRSLEKLEGYMDRFDLIFPSHGTCPLSPDYIPRLKEKAKDVLEGKTKGELIRIHGMNVMKHDVALASFLLDAQDGDENA